MDIHLSTHNEFLAKLNAAMLRLPEELTVDAQLPMIVAISGGPDSTAMLLALRLVSQHRPLSILACHVNHKLRGDESEKDEQYCRQLCMAIGVPLDVYQDANPVQAASESQLRATRYEFLYSCAQQHASQSILLAHSQSDQIETMLFRLFRGTSVSGLAGMRPFRKMKNNIWLVRPILNCTRLEVQAFLDHSGIVARHDSSNDSDKYSRNFLRNKVIPLCLSRFPNFGTQLERLRQLSVSEDEFLDRSTNEFVEKLGGLDSTEWSESLLTSRHIALQRRALLKSLEHRDIEVSFERIETVLNMMAEKTFSRISMNEIWDITFESNKLIWLNKSEPKTPRAAIAEVRIKIPGSTVIAALGKIVRVEDWRESAPEIFPHRTEFRAFVDLSRITMPLVLRERRPGDTIQPLGMSQPVGLKKYIHTHKANVDADDALHGAVLCDQHEVLWVLGVGLSDKIKVTDSPTHLIQTLDIASDVTIA